eukprot:1394444-Amorphochlora_amoeboformis.AAC.2
MHNGEETVLSLYRTPSKRSIAERILHTRSVTIARESLGKEPKILTPRKSGKLSGTLHGSFRHSLGTLTINNSTRSAKGIRGANQKLKPNLPSVHTALTSRDVDS